MLVGEFVALTLESPRHALAPLALDEQGFVEWTLANVRETTRRSSESTSVRPRSAVTTRMNSRDPNAAPFREC